MSYLIKCTLCHKSLGFLLCDILPKNGSFWCAECIALEYLEGGMSNCKHCVPDYDVPILERF